MLIVSRRTLSPHLLPDFSAQQFAVGHCTISFSQTVNTLGHETWSIFDESQVDHVIENGAQLTKLKKKIKPH